jgi:dTDP-4-amino-4,6-dideoxygalactose transaminase
MPRLAIAGGEPIAPDGLETQWPVFDERERERLVEVLESGKWCSAGYFFEDEESTVERFEREFAAYVGTDHATAVPNGTQALELAFGAIGIEPGDEVIVPAVTFVASASAVVRANGVPVFVDVDPETYQLSAAAVEEAITDRTKAIEVVHYGGYPADMDRMREIADEHDLYLVEDAAEAHGTEWRGEKVGSLGDVGCFSLQMGKALTCGEGGVVTYDDGELVEKIYSYANLGRTPGGKRYEHAVPGGNYRLSEFLGGVLLEQLSRLDEQTETRHANGRYFADQLSDVPGMTTLKEDPRITDRGYYFYFLRYDPAQWNGVHRDTVVDALEAEGVPCGTAHNDPLYQHPAFAEIDPSLLHGHERDYSTVRCPEAERIYESEVIALGKDFLMRRENVETVVEAVRKLRRNVDELAAADGTVG